MRKVIEKTELETTLMFERIKNTLQAENNLIGGEK